MNYHEISADIRKRGAMMECRKAPPLKIFKIIDKSGHVCGTIETFSHGAACEIMGERCGRRWYLKYRVA